MALRLTLVRLHWQIVAMSDLKLRIIPVNFLDGSTSQARAEGNNAAWICQCSAPIPLLGRCFPPAHPPETVCSDCGRRYAIQMSEKRPTSVAELPAARS